jgi:hypothetical protein
MKEKNDTDFFVEVKDPVEIRKAILEASKKSIKLLQNYESIKKIRAEKSEEIEKLKVQMKETELLVAKFKTELPKVKDVIPPEFKKLFFSKPAAPKITRMPVKIIEARPRPMPKEETVDKLDQELMDIEAELERLS